MNVEELVGMFSIVGVNQDESKTSYKGILEFTLDTHNRIIARWLINGDQVQSGVGFFKDNTLVVNFNYLGEDDTLYKGVVVYNCVTNDYLDGFWSEELGNPSCLGEEHCYRIVD